MTGVTRPQGDSFFLNLRASLDRSWWVQGALLCSGAVFGASVGLMQWPIFNKPLLRLLIGATCVVAYVAMLYKLRAIAALADARSAQLENMNRHLQDGVRFSQTVTDNLPGLVAYWDADLRCRFANRQYMSWFGKSPAEMIGAQFSDLLNRDAFDANMPFLQRALAGEQQQFERTLTMPSGELMHVFATLVPDLDPNGKVAGIFVLASDVTALKRAEADQRIAATAFESSEGMVITDAKVRVLKANRAFIALTGTPVKALIGSELEIIQQGLDGEIGADALWRTVAETGTWSGEALRRRFTGEVFPCRLTVTAVRDSAACVSHYVVTFSDITARRAAEEEVRKMAFYDALTTLPNRRLLLERLQSRLCRADPDAGMAALLFIDLDKFKLLNDTAGHEKGDLLLQQVALRLLGAVGADDTVARLGGDEFVVLLPDIGSADTAPARAATLATAIASALIAAYDLGGYAHMSTPSIGVTLFSSGSGDAAGEVLKRADHAMYQSKQAGRNTISFGRMEPSATSMPTPCDGAMSRRTRSRHARAR